MHDSSPVDDDYEITDELLEASVEGPEPEIYIPDECLSDELDLKVLDDDDTLNEFILQKTATVDDLINKFKGSQSENYDLVDDGNIVRRDLSLRDAGVSMDSKLKFKERTPEPQIKFKVRQGSGSRINVDIPPTKTVQNLEDYLRDVEKVREGKQSFSFNGKGLSDNSTLGSCGIKNGSEVYMTGTMFGG